MEWNARFQLSCTQLDANSHKVAKTLVEAAIIKSSDFKFLFTLDVPLILNDSQAARRGEIWETLIFVSTERDS